MTEARRLKKADDHRMNTFHYLLTLMANIYPINLSMIVFTNTVSFFFTALQRTL